MCCGLTPYHDLTDRLDNTQHSQQSYRKNSWLLKKKIPGLINQLDHLRIDNINDARALVGHLHPPERELLKTALKEQWDKSVHLDEGI